MSPDPTAAPRPALVALRDTDPTADVSASTASILTETFDVVVVDLPAVDAVGDDRATSVVRAVRASGAARWLLAAHGSGGAVASEVATLTMSGEAGLFGFAGLVLVGSASAGDRLDVPTLLVDDAVIDHADGLAEAVTSFWRDHAGHGPAASRDFADVIASTHTSPQTRAILARRALADDPGYQPQVLTATQLDTLRLVADLVVPQRAPSPDAAIDLAARIDADQAAGASDGWRNAALPPDAEAYRRGLDALADLRLLGTDDRKARVAAIVAGEFEPADGELTAEQMQLWFEDARVDLVRGWLAHPATMERIGFDGFANGGPGGALFQGFDLLGADRREQWEPTMEAVR